MVAIFVILALFSTAFPATSSVNQRPDEWKPARTVKRSERRTGKGKCTRRGCAFIIVSSCKCSRSSLVVSYLVVVLWPRSLFSFHFPRPRASLCARDKRFVCIDRPPRSLIVQSPRFPTTQRMSRCLLSIDRDDVYERTDEGIADEAFTWLTNTFNPLPDDLIPNSRVI